MSKNIKQKTKTPEYLSNDSYSRHLLIKSACANNLNPLKESFDLETAMKDSAKGIHHLQTRDGLRALLATQMLSIHEMQQTTLMYANSLNIEKSKLYYINASIKLANTFVQQATLLAKLTGLSTQQLHINRVDVHDGGQAIVGNVQHNNETEFEKK